MLIRRCAILLIEPRERLDFDFPSLLEGGDGLRAEREWIALAPHLDGEVTLGVAELTPLGAIPVHSWMEFDAAAAEHDATVLRTLLGKGLLIGATSEYSEFRKRDDALRDTHWHAPAAVAHAFSRWQGVAAGEPLRGIGITSVADLVEKLGNPPPHFGERALAGRRQALTRPSPGVIDTLLRRRATCRNYDLARRVPFSTFSHLLHRAFGAQAVHEVTAEAAIVKKTSPSAGGLHPTEAYLLVQGVEDVAIGLYHYHAGEHALEPMQSLTTPAALELANRFLAQQDWFANAHAIVVLAPRFRRNFWKYRNHAKAYRAVTLDVGHLSQTLQISATEFGLGAFVTSAINEIDIERTLGLEPMQECPLAICGFGWRAVERVHTEFDPLRAVWSE
jgi:putative peptide maturation dehydrogenase